MEIYLVRHGETSGNVGKRHQPARTRLTKRGEVQAAEVAEVLAGFRPTHLITSSQVRAVETSRIIGDRVCLVPDTTELFKELVRPSRIHGRKHRSISSLWYIFMWFLGKRGGGGEKEGESRTQFYDRMQEAKVHLESLPADARAVVVSHSVFINLFISMIENGGTLSFFRGVSLFVKILIMPNTAVTKMTLESNEAGWVWRVIQ